MPEDNDTGDKPKTMMQHFNGLMEAEYGQGGKREEETQGGEETESVTVTDTESQPDDDDQSSGGDEGSGAEGEPDEGKEQSKSDGDESKGDGASSSDDPKDDDGSEQKKAKVAMRPKADARSQKIDWNKRLNQVAKDLMKQQMADESVREELDNASPLAKRTFYNSLQARAQQIVNRERTAAQNKSAVVSTNRDKMYQTFGNDWADVWRSEQFYTYVMSQPKYVRDTIVQNNQNFIDFESVSAIFQQFQEHSGAGERKGEEKQQEGEKSQGKPQEKQQSKRKDRNPPGPKPKPAKSTGLDEPGPNATVKEHLQHLYSLEGESEDEDTQTYL